MFLKLLRISKIKILLILFSFLFLFISCIYSQSERVHRFKIVILIDVFDFNCGNCVVRFSTLIDEIKNKKLEKDTIGVFVFQGHDDEKIIEKEIRGFIKGNRINFPILMDKTNKFENLKKAYDVLLFCYKDKMIHGFRYNEFIERFLIGDHEH